MKSSTISPVFSSLRGVLPVQVFVAVVVTVAVPLWAVPEAEKLGKTPPGLSVLAIETSDESFWAVYHRWMSDPNNLQARVQLAEAYSKPKGYASLAKFFLQTAAFMDDKALALDKGSGLGDFVQCSLYSGPFNEAREKSRKARAAADELAAMIGSGETTPQATAVAADKAVDSFGSHCGLLAEWSLANLRLFLHDQTTVNLEREELALRLLVTLAEGGTSPSGQGGAAPVYFFLSEYFAAKQDYVSAYVAGLYARQRLAEGGATGSWEQSSFAEILSSRLEALLPLAVK